MLDSRSAKIVLAVIFLEHFFQFVAQHKPRPVKTAANRSHRHVEHFGDLFVTVSVDLAEYEDAAMFFAKPPQRRLHLFGSFVSFDAVGRRVVAAHGFVSAGVADFIDRRGRLTPPPSANGKVQGDSVQPRIKRAVAFERTQLDERLDERLLHQVACVFDGPRDVDQRVVQPVLIAQDQVAKRRRSATERFVDKLKIVYHDLFR